ncbi:MAG: pectin acetylesterase-family hydrolase [Polyangiales bacterium]
MIIWRNVVFFLASTSLALSGCSTSSNSTGGAGSKSGSGGSAASKAGGAGHGSAGSAGASKSGGATGAAGSGATGGKPPFMPTGSPLTGPDGAWTFVGFPDSKCRDGSTAGVAVNLKPGSKKVMIYLEGGGACFDTFTCLANASNTSSMMMPAAAGILDRSNAENPVKDWNFVYVPYCTGDVHLGTKDDGMIAGVAGTQHFMGRRNLEAYLNRLVPTFPDADEVLLTGVSAGGFGASANAEFVQWAFGDIPVSMIDDSGPAMSDKYIPTCLQKAWRTTWGLDGSVLQDCGADCPDPDNFEMDYMKHMAGKAMNRPAGLIEATTDSTITVFYGYGTNNCTGNFATPVPGATFTQGLLDFRAAIQMLYPNFGTYYITSSQHTWLGGASFYSTTVGGMRMVDWFKNIVTGTSATQVGP